MANTNETVTVRLIVAADGALRTLDRFDKELVTAANSAVKASSGVDAFTTHVERMRKAQEAGIPVLKARAAAIQQEERVLQNALGRAEPVYKAQIAAERELGRVVAASSNLVVHGKMRQEDAIQNIMAVEQAHVAQINKVVAAERRAAEAAQATAASVRNSAGAVQAYNLSASRNAFESSNIAMQFQDIAVSAQMGMSPMMIALQQGTQLSAVFNQMKNPLQALPAAFLSIINPVSLLTIGFVGLAAVGAQWAANIFNGAEEANTALEDHLAILDKIMVGYEDAREASKDFIEQAQQRAEGAVASDLAEQREAVLREIDSTLSQIDEKQATIAADLVNLRLGGDLFADLIRASEGLTELEFSAAMSRGELGHLETQLTELANSDAPDRARGYADELLNLLQVLRRLIGEVGSFDTALRELPRHIQISMSMSREFVSASEGLNDLYIDPRSRFEIAREEAKNLADQATATAQSYGDLVGIGEDYARVLASIDAAEAEAAEKLGGSSGGSSGGGGGGGTNPADTWRENMEAFQQRIAQQELEISTFGQGTFEIERQRAAFELLNQAKAAGVPITDTVTASVNSMASEYAQATLQLERMQLQQQQIDQLNSALASGFSNLFIGILNGSQSAEEGISKLLGSLGQLFINQAFQTLFAPAAMGGMGFNPFGFLTGMMSFDGGGYTGNSPRVGGLDGQGGRLAIVHPRETIIDHTRGGGVPATNVIINANIQAPPGGKAEDGAAFARAFTKELNKQLPDAIDRVNRNNLRRSSGGSR